MMHYRPCELIIDLARIAANARALKDSLQPGTRLMAVVKADGYGHGAVQVARAALSHGADMLAVALPEEGEALRLAGIAAPVLVMGAATSEGAEAAVRLNLAQTVFDEQGVSDIACAAKRQGKQAQVHIKADSGMARLGVRNRRELAALLECVEHSPHVQLSGIFTHFACADAPDEAYTRLQYARFMDMLSGIDLTGVMIHAANSAAALRYPWARLDAVRVGVALYGAPPVSTALDLFPAQRWVTHAVMVKDISEGERVSYGGLFTAQRASTVMTLPVGYADGYRRGMTGQAQVLVRGRRAHIIGRICMDQCMADVTDIPGVCKGDEVVLLGSQGHVRITPEEMADWMQSIPYEVMLSPSARVPRTYLQEHAP